MGGFEQSYEDKLRNPHYGKATKVFAEGASIETCGRVIEKGSYSDARKHQKNGTVCEMFDGMLPDSVEGYADGLRRYAYDKMQVGCYAHVRKQKVSPSVADARLNAALDMANFCHLAHQLFEGYILHRKPSSRQSIVDRAKASILSILE